MTTQNNNVIDWTYWDKIINIKTFWIAWNNNIVINIHGTFGSMTWWNDKYINFAQNLQENWISNAVLYESSRKNVEIDPNITDRYKQKQAKFIGKTFENELEDARRVLQFITNNSLELFLIPKDKIQITLTGNSLWGIIAFYLASEFHEVSNIVTVGTGLRIEMRDVPILDTFPFNWEEDFFIKQFRWKYIMIRGTEDDVFDEKSFMNLYNLVWTEEENKESITLVWVDHTFGKINWEKSELPYKEVYKAVSKLLYV